MLSLITLSSGEAEQPFNWSVGMHGSKFFAELKDNKRIMGIRCPKCKKVYLPPRRVCGPCFAEMDEWVELGNQGIITNYTVVHFSFLDPETGKQRPVPYGYGHIKLDGSDTDLQHFIDVTDIDRISMGTRVEAVFEEKRTGSLMDIKYFKAVQD